MTRLVIRPGDHVRLSRYGGLYQHHTIYEGNGWFIAFQLKPGMERHAVVREHWDETHRNDPVEVVQYARCLPANQTVALAQSQLGATNFDLWSSNCEHFAHWCKTGVPHSAQSEVAQGVAAATGITAAASLAGTAMIQATPLALGSVAAAPTIAVGMGLAKAYADDPNLPMQERHARNSGRTGAVVGGLLGTVASVFAVASAAEHKGVTHGLDELGAVFGYGRKTGIAVACAIPALAAAVSAYAFYKGDRSQGQWSTPSKTILT